MEHLSSFSHYAKFLIFILLPIFFIGCENDDSKCPQYTGIIFDRALCSSEKATLIKVTNKEVGSTYRNEENIILAAVDFDSINISGTMYMRGTLFNIGDTIYFDFIEKKIETITCPTIFGLPSFQARITSISKNKCLATNPHNDI